jgi:hypothetical protein
LKQRGHVLLNGSGRRVAIAEEVNLILANLRRPQPVGRSIEMLENLSTILMYVRGGILSVVSMLEFLQHYSSSTVHKTSL